MKILAPAKINWSIFVLDKLSNGYHNILSVMQPISLYDTIQVEEDDKISLQTDMRLPAEDNLVIKAAKALASYCNVFKGVKITLTKQIPTGAGLGGGSSDAAATLIALNDLWQCNLNIAELITIASMIGADVPFFIHCNLAIVSGWGEIVQPLPKSVAQRLLIVKPNFNVPTAWAYSELDKYRRDHNIAPLSYEICLQRIIAISSGLMKGDIASVATMLDNDFQKVVALHYPEIDIIRQKLLDCGAIVALMSGSGSAIYALFPDELSLDMTMMYFRDSFCVKTKTIV